MDYYNRLNLVERTDISATSHRRSRRHDDTTERARLDLEQSGRRGHRISELEEQLGERDEAFGASTTTATKVKRHKPSSVATAASSSRSLTKKFKIKKSK